MQKKISNGPMLINILIHDRGRENIQQPAGLKPSEFLAHLSPP